MQHTRLILFVSLAVLSLPSRGAEVVKPLQGHKGNLAVQVADLKELRESFKLTAFGNPNYSKLKVAVLDKGFAGVYPARTDGRLWLPGSTEVVTGYAGTKTVSPLDPKDFHGTHMAHLIWAMTNYATSGPQFRLYNASSPDNFVAATEDLIAWGADIVLFSQNWPGFGNFDGSGFLNEALREVTDHRILWFNAAGNYGGKVYNGTASFHPTAGNEWITVKPERTDTYMYYLKFVNEVDENAVTVSLAWNSVFPGWVKKGTEKDLDLYLYGSDKNGKVEGKAFTSSTLTQSKDPQGVEETLFPLEQITVTLPRGTYYIAVQATNNKAAFSATKDKIRVTVMGAKQPFWDADAKKLKSSVTFTDATGDGEIMTPADGPGLTVGDLTQDSAKGPTVDGRGKPEIVLEKNNVTFTDKNGYYGTSYAAAYMAGIASVLKATRPEMQQKDFLKFRAFYPTDQWEKQGWKPFTPSNTYSVDAVLQEWVKEKFGADHAFVRTTESRSVVAVVGDFTKHFTNVSHSDDNAYFFRVQRRETTKQELVPAKTEWKWVTLAKGHYKTEWKTERKSRRVMVRQGQYYWEYRTDTQRIDANVVDIYGRKLGSVNLGTLITQTPVKKYKEPEYDTQYYNQQVPHEVWVPEKRDFRQVTTPAHYQKVAGETQVTKSLAWTSKTSKQPIWERYAGRPEEFTQIVELKSPYNLGDGLVVDGSRSEPRIWQTPSRNKLSEELR